MQLTSQFIAAMPAKRPCGTMWLPKAKLGHVYMRQTFPKAHVELLQLEGLDHCDHWQATLSDLPSVSASLAAQRG